MRAFFVFLLIWIGISSASAQPIPNNPWIPTTGGIGYQNGCVIIGALTCEGVGTLNIQQLYINNAHLIFDGTVYAPLGNPINATGGFATWPVPLNSGTSGTLTVANGGTGVISFTAGLPIIGNGASALALGSVSGNTTEFATISGALTNGHCVSISIGNLVDAGAACGGGSGGSGTVTSGVAGSLTYYPTTGTTVAAASTGTGVLTALANNVGAAGALITNGGALGTPSSGTLTNATGLPISTGLTGAGTSVLAAMANALNGNSGLAAFNSSGNLTVPGTIAVVGSALLLQDTGGAAFIRETNSGSSTLSLGYSSINVINISSAGVTSTLAISAPSFVGSLALSNVTGLGTGVATALGDAANASGGLATYPIAASTLSGSALPSGITTSSLTTFGLNPGFAFRTGAPAAIYAQSANTGFGDAFGVYNTGTASNSATYSQFSSILNCSSCFTTMTSLGGSSPSGAINSGAGLTGGLTITAAVGNLTLAATSGSVIVPFVQPQTGATAITQQQHSQFTVNMVDFMTPGQPDGTTNNSSDFQKLNNYCGSVTDPNKQGITVYLAPLHYIVNDVTYNCPINFVGVNGTTKTLAGWADTNQGTVLDYSNASYWMFKWVSTNFPNITSYQKIGGGGVTGVAMYAASQSSSSYALRFWGVDKPVVRDVTALGVDTNIIDYYGGFSGVFENIDGQNVGGNGILIHGDLTGQQYSGAACVYSSGDCSTRVDVPLIRHVNFAGSTGICYNIQGFVDTVMQEHTTCENEVTNVMLSCPSGGGGLAICPEFYRGIDVQGEAQTSFSFDLSDFTDFRCDLCYATGFPGPYPTSNVFARMVNYTPTAGGGGGFYWTDGTVYGANYSCMTLDVYDIHVTGGYVQYCNEGNHGSAGVELNTNGVSSASDAQIMGVKFCRTIGYPIGTAPMTGILIASGTSGTILDTGNNYTYCNAGYSNASSANFHSTGSF